MRGSRLGLLAAAALVAGLGGCSLPEVLPLAGGTTSGPSPYGPWYEQHWATNAVLLAAADQPDEFVDGFGDESEAAPADTMPQVDQGPAPEPTPVKGAEAVDFDNSSPYQFPSSEFAPAPTDAPSSTELTPPTPSAPKKKSVPASDEPIRY